MIQTMTPPLVAALHCIVALATTAAELPYSVPEKPWDSAWGNHRARVRVAAPAEAVSVHLPWRRRDHSAADKAIFVIHAATQKRVSNVAPIAVSREAGTIVFQAVVAGEYHVYFMPFATQGRAFATTHYNKPEPTADPTWLRRHQPNWQMLPTADIIDFQSRTEFDRRDPMELVATEAERKALLDEHPAKPLLLFPEDRTRPIRMVDDLPVSWIERGPSNAFAATAQRNEFYVFQIGVFASKSAMEDVQVEMNMGDLPIRCINTGGNNWLGRRFDKTVSVPAGKVQALWFGVDVPECQRPGIVQGAVKIGPRRGASQTVAVSLTIEDAVLKDRGDSELWRMSRIRWLDSTVGLDDTVTAPYTPLVVEGNTIRCLGRSLTTSATGLPQSITAGENELLASPIDFAVETKEGTVVWTAGEQRVTSRNAAAVTWESTSTGGGFTLRCTATTEFDGYTNFQLALQADQATDVRDCRLEIPLKSRFAKYMMGMSRKGGLRPDSFQWTWDPARHQDCLWLGNVDGGIQCKLKGPNYRWPLVNIHYHHRPLLMPEAWHNEGKGGCLVAEQGDRVVFRAFGGTRAMKAGDELRFDFGLLITPVKPLAPKDHWTHRYYHSGVPAPEAVAEQGARIINIHHGNAINPFINYPFLTEGKLRPYINEAHELGLKVKLYYTIRELTNHVAELWALRSLGAEIFPHGPGGGYAWLHEHLVKDYSPAWHHRFGDGTWCASISQTGLSRWHNYYIEGLGYLARNLEIDGLYLDEIGYDREIMKRVRRVLDRERPGALLDLHSWNHLNGRAGFANCLNLYLEHLPYLNSLWIGEGRNYDEPPDHWMVEIAGIPFGLMSEMLQGGGNPWRGMLYGMTNRLPWSGNPTPIWDLWDEFGIADSQMLGYWDPTCPVSTGREDVLATVYRKQGSALICVASWARREVECALKIDWEALGFDPAKAKFYAPEIQGLQAEDLFQSDEPLPIAPGKGWMLILDERPRTLHSIQAADAYETRRALLEETFTDKHLRESWKTVLSTREGGTLSTVDGAMVVKTTANSCAFAERPLPPGTTLVECILDSGTDKGQTWGLGLGLAWNDGRFLRIHLRTEDKRFGYDDGRKVYFGPAIGTGLKRVRMRFEAKEIVLEYLYGIRRGTEQWRLIGRFDRSKYPGDPTSVRLGKMNHAGRNVDFRQPGPTGTCRASNLRVWGSAPAS